MTASATSPINTSTTTTPTTNTAATKDATSAGRTSLAQNFDTFLTLLTTQMKNQDPTSPMDSSQFTSQLVQMTGVEQQLASNDLLKQLVANTGTNLSSAVGLIGKDVRATSNDAALSNGEAKWGYSLPADATDVKIEVLDSTGLPVRTLAGSTADGKAGEHTFTWDGKDQFGAKMPDGTYTLRLTTKDSADTTIQNTVFVEGTVTAIQQDNGQSVVTINGTKVPVGQVTSVTQPTTSTSASGGGSGAGTDPTTTAGQTSA